MSEFESLQMQHTSLQFSDTDLQQKQDVQDLFEKGRKFPIKTGTEAGPETESHGWLEKYAGLNNHNIHFARDCWIAVDRAIVKQGTFKRGEVFIAKNTETFGNGHDTVMATVEFQHNDDRIGHVAIGCVHYPVRGAHKGDPNYRINVRAAKFINRWMKRTGGGKYLAFVNGDFNMPDDNTDWDFGQGFTSMADELDAHQNTGHGPIDGFCSFDGDHRVSAGWFNVLDDKEMFQFGDHFVVRGAWKIKHLGK